MAVGPAGSPPLAEPVRPANLTRAFARLAPANLGVQVLSFASSILLATLLGASTSTDAYYLALSIPAVVFAVLLAAIQLGGIPVLTKLGARQGDRSLAEAASELVSGVLVASVALSVVVTAVMYLLLPATTQGSHELILLTRRDMLELLPFSVSGGLLGAFGAVLSVRGRFAITTLVLGFEPVVKSLLLLAFHRQLGAQALILGNIAGNLLAVLTLWYFTRRAGLSLKLSRFWSSPTVRSVLALSAPLVISQSVLQLNPLIDRATAASLGGGSVTQFELGVRVFSAPTTLLTAALVAPLAASWAARLAQTGWQSVVDSFIRVARTLFLIIPVLVVSGLLVRHQLIAVAYHSHAYDAHDVSKTASVFGMLLLGFLPQVLVVAVSTLFVIRGNTVFPMIIGISNCIINAALDVVLRGPLGVAGIALGTSLTIAVLTSLYVLEAHRRWGSLRLLAAAPRPLGISALGCIWAVAAYRLALQLAPPRVTRLENFLFIALFACLTLIGLGVSFLAREKVARYMRSLAARVLSGSGERSTVREA